MDGWGRVKYIELVDVCRVGEAIIMRTSFVVLCAVDIIAVNHLLSYLYRHFFLHAHPCHQPHHHFKCYRKDISIPESFWF